MAKKEYKTAQVDGKGDPLGIVQEVYSLNRMYPRKFYP